MVITPKNHFKKYHFVDRKICLENFKEAVTNIRLNEFSVLVYYGVAGIGKTSLKKEFVKYLEAYNKENKQQDVTFPLILQKEIIWASIDLQLDKHREKSTFLVTLKNDLQGKYKINFPAFEIAHAIYWKKANPEIALREENYLFFEGDDAFDDFFGVVNQIPYFSIVPATARLIKKFPDYLRKWWKKRGQEELSLLSEKEPLEIEEMLPYFLAQDLNNYLEDTSKPAVLFIDTYEVLREKYSDDSYSLDKLIREELISRFPKNVLWVICSREALRWKEIDNEWDKYLIQYEVEKLFEKYCIEYLESREITDKEVQESILKGSKGVPYYLELSADTYQKIKKTGEKPEPEDFGKNYKEIADRFFRFLRHEEKDSLYVLSVPRFWDYDLFKYLAKEFNTGYLINNYEDLCSFSFVGKAENEKYQMHQLMQESLQKTQKPDSIKRIHKAICDYYSDKLRNVDIKAITTENEIALTEAFYHAKKSLKAEDLFNWFIVASDPFNRAAFLKLIVPLYEEVLQIIEEELEPEHLSVATALNNLALLYDRMGIYDKALPLSQRALDIREKVLITEDSDVATSLINLALLYQHMGVYDKAFLLYQRAFDIYEKVLDPEHPDIATALNNLALLYLYIGAYDKALPLYERALDIYEKVLGPHHPDVSASLNNLALLYQHMGAYDKALPLYERALDIVEKVLGPEHPSVATSLHNLSLINQHVGAYDKAIPFSQRALEIYEKVLGQEHPYFATSLNNLAGLYQNMGAYDKALPLSQRALGIREKVLGPHHPDVSASLNNLASIYGRTGAYDKALLLYERALDIVEKALDPEHPDVATTLNNLALLYQHMGAYDKALPLYERAFDIREKVLGPHHPDVSASLNNLALLYFHMGAYDKALPLYERALDIREKVLGPDHPYFATSLNNLAGLYQHMGAYDKALPLYERALDIVEKVLGPEHPSVATSLNNLAGLYQYLEAYDKALSLYERALDIVEKALGPEHPDFVVIQNNLTSLLLSYEDGSL